MFKFLAGVIVGSLGATYLIACFLSSGRESTTTGAASVDYSWRATSPLT